MSLIQLSGNYAFFNWLGIALSLLLFDDSALSPLFRHVFPNTHAIGAPASPSFISIPGIAAILILVLSLDAIARLFQLRPNWPRPLARFFDLLEPFHLVNSYGLFAVMTTWRPEIVMEGSNDGVHWQEYQFKWKPGDPRHAPGFVAPNQPRLDWQIWFAALGVAPDSWFDRFRERLLEGSPEVLALLKTNPFPEEPPRHIRAVIYEYGFTNRTERRETGAWWHRDWRGPLGKRQD
jgi:hypothetical protein